MPIKIMLAVPTLNRRDRLIDMLASVARSTLQPDRVLLINNGGQITDHDRLEWGRLFNLDVFTPAANLGVAASVNYAMRNTPEGWWWLHSNDDVELDSRCIELMVKSAEQAGEPPFPLGHFIVPEHGVGSAFTLFMAYKLAGSVGYFDEQFSPVYFEDNDLGRRMNIAGIQRIVVKGAAYTHHISSTLNGMKPEEQRKFHDSFRALRERYIAKWGGPPEEEKFGLPYDGARGHTLANIHLWHKEWL